MASAKVVYIQSYEYRHTDTDVYKHTETL